MRRPVARVPIVSRGAIALVLAAAAPALGASEAPLDLRLGDPVRIFDTRAILGGAHYVNDHTLIRDAAGRFHLFGIFHAEPYAGERECVFVHAISRGTDLAGLTLDLADPPFALEQDSRIGETHLWAPHVVGHEGGYFMFYQSGGRDGDHAQIRSAGSCDLGKWGRSGPSPLFEDFCVARDPMVLRIGSLWVMYYTRCDAQRTRKSGVACRTSSDLRRWSEPSMALVVSSSEPAGDSGCTESPFVFERGGFYYLSVTAYPVAWDATFLYRSRSPFRFSEPPVARLHAHAAEWVVDAGSGALYLTHAGPGQGGVWLTAVNGL